MKINTTKIYDELIILSNENYNDLKNYSNRFVILNESYNNLYSVSYYNLKYLQLKFIIIESLIKINSQQQPYQAPMSSPIVCLNCQTSSSQNVILKCDHELCFTCANHLKSIQGQNALDIKYKISCPYCRMNTITLNIANLISQQQQKLVFVNMQDSELSQREFQKNNYQNNSQAKNMSQLREMSYNDRINMIFTDRRTPQLPQRNNKRGSIDSSRSRVSKSRQGYQTPNQDTIDIQCAQHKQQKVIFYCREQNSLLCMNCMYSHIKQHKNHSIGSIKQSMPLIQKQNKKYKFQAHNHLEQIQKQLLTYKQNKSKLQQAYIFLEQMIKKQFKQLESLLKLKEKQVSQYLQKTFGQKQLQLTNKYQELIQTKHILADYQSFNITNSYQHVYFFTNYNEINLALQQNPLHYKLKQYKDQDLLCFQRNSTTKDFQNLIQKLFIPKSNGRQSNRSRGTSRSKIQKPSKIQQLKEISQQTLKLAKRKMKQINKKIDSGRDFKKDKKYDFLQNFNIQDTIKRNQKGSSLNQKVIKGNVWTPTPQLQKYATTIANKKKSQKTNQKNEKQKQKK